MKSTKKCTRSSADKEQKEILVASVARWEHLRRLIVQERKCMDFGEAIEQFSEKQEMLATDGEQGVSAKKMLQKGFRSRSSRS